MNDIAKRLWGEEKINTFSTDNFPSIFHKQLILDFPVACFSRVLIGLNFQVIRYNIEEKKNDCNYLGPHSYDYDDKENDSLDTLADDDDSFL